MSGVVFLLTDYASLAFFNHLHIVKIDEMTQEMQHARATCYV